MCIPTATKLCSLCYAASSRHRSRVSILLRCSPAPVYAFHLWRFPCASLFNFIRQHNNVVILDVVFVQFSSVVIQNVVVEDEALVLWRDAAREFRSVGDRLHT